MVGLLFCIKDESFSFLNQDTTRSGCADDVLVPKSNKTIEQHLFDYISANLYSFYDKNSEIIHSQIVDIYSQLIEQTFSWCTLLYICVTFYILCLFSTYIYYLTVNSIVHCREGYNLCNRHLIHLQQNRFVNLTFWIGSDLSIDLFVNIF